MPLRHDVVERILIAKTLLDSIRFQSPAKPTRFTITTHTLTAHDAAELAIAAIANQLGASPHKDQNYLMNYFDPIKQKMHPERDVFAKDYFSSLNRLRVDIKHYGIFPDPTQWARVGEITYGHVSKWCSEYLGVTLGHLDETALLVNEDIKNHVIAAREAADQGQYRQSLEELGEALFIAFDQNLALRGLLVGHPRPEDAIRLSGYGIHANDFLTMQEFLPNVSRKEGGEFSVTWQQSSYGHPGNWRENATTFCYRAFLQVALRIQDAEWVPGAIHFAALYQTQITSLRDGVELWEMSNVGRNELEILAGTRVEKKVVRVLSKGESIRGYVHLQKPPSGFYGISSKWQKPESGGDATISISTDDQFGLNVRLGDVTVTCVPRDAPIIKEHFPNLPEVDWTPE